MITYGLLLAFTTPIFWIFNLIPPLPYALSEALAQANSFFYGFLEFAIAWQNWIPIHLIGLLASAYFALWAATIGLRFFRVVYSMLFGGGGSL